jgi:UDP-glucose 4-epimerase
LAEGARRIAVTAGRSPLARRVIERLRADARVELVRAIEPSQAPHRGKQRGEDVDVVPFAPDHRPFTAYLEQERIDTVIQCGLVPDRSGLAERTSEADVIGTMCLGAAIAHEGVPVRCWVLASSTAIYPIDSRAPMFQRERRELPHEDESIAASIAEAEDYAADLAERLSDVNVAILRLQQIADREVRGPLAGLLASRLVPSPIGFDPVIQLLHLDDAVSALAFAALAELAGLYNVASAGVIHWGDAVRATGNSSVPVLPLGSWLLEPLLECVGVPHLPRELVELLRFGHAVDTRKLESTGWKPGHDQLAVLRELSRTTP